MFDENTKEKQKQWAENQQEKIKDLTIEIDKKVKNFVDDPQELLEFSVFCSKFRDYSFRNRILIYKQDPNASLVASFKKWNELGFNVLKGAKSLKILAPVINEYYKDENGKEKKIYKNDKRLQELIQKKAIKPYKKISYYKTVNVFSDNSTSITKEDLPQFAKGRLTFNIEKDMSIFIEGLKEVCKDRGIEVVYPKDTKLFTNGFYSHVKKSISILNRKNSYTEFNILTHELAHNILHDKDSGLMKNNLKTEIKEVQAEFAACCLSKYYAREVDTGQIAYIKDYASKLDEKEYQTYIEALVDPITDLITEIDKKIQTLAYERDKKIEIDYGLKNYNEIKKANYSSFNLTPCYKNTLQNNVEKTKERTTTSVQIEQKLKEQKVEDHEQKEQKHEKSLKL